LRPELGRRARLADAARSEQQRHLAGTGGGPPERGVERRAQPLATDVAEPASRRRRRDVQRRLDRAEEPVAPAALRADPALRAAVVAERAARLLQCARERRAGHDRIWPERAQHLGL
jgi:hypothetical protein